MENNDNENQALDWDSEISHQEMQYILLNPGPYPFKVTGFQRARHMGSAKIPPCNKATLALEIDGGQQGKVTINKDLFLSKVIMNILNSFFESIGAQKNTDGVIKMNWDTVLGASGMCEIKHKAGFKDPSKIYNEIDKFLPAAKTNDDNEPF